MKRAQATAAVEQMLQRFFDGRDERPLSMVTEIAVFGSFARGATDPHDVDIMVQFAHDRQWASEAVRAMSSGRDPHSAMRRALTGGKRSLQIVCEQLPDDVTVGAVVLWRSGDTLTHAVDRLHAIAADENAARAPRDAMIPAFAGLDRHLGRPVRESLASAAAAGALSVEQVTLEDRRVTDPFAREHIERRWQASSPLHRGAHAALAYYEQSGVDTGRVHLHGRDLDAAGTTHFCGMQLRYFRAIPYCLGRHGGRQWLEVVRLTASKPLVALLVTPLDPGKMRKLTW